jgi:NADPH2:quinone reductase
MHKIANVQGLFKGYATSSWDRIARIPEGLSSKYGASLLQGLTALTNLKESYEVKKGDWILVHAIAGGLGLQLCQVGNYISFFFDFFFSMVTRYRKG